MYKMAKAPDREREILFWRTAERKGLPVAAVEKDFWFCLTLDYLFHRCPWKNDFVFRGAASLAKGYGLLERFSDDMDLIFDWRVLGYSDVALWADRSQAAQAEFNRGVNARAAGFFKDIFLPQFQKDMSQLLGRAAEVYMDEQEAGTIHFVYPCLFREGMFVRSIRLEIETLAAWTPTRRVTIMPYAAEEYGKSFEQAQTKILVSTAARSFWEKVTILHEEAFRPETVPAPPGYSRHYYDVYVMAGTRVCKEALSELELLRYVVSFKRKFYPQPQVRYELAAPGTLRLLPPRYGVAALQDDYASLRTMIYGDYPSYELLVNVLTKLENKINSKR